MQRQRQRHHHHWRRHRRRCRHRPNKGISILSLSFSSVNRIIVSLQFDADTYLPTYLCRSLLFHTSFFLSDFYNMQICHKALRTRVKVGYNSIRKLGYYSRKRFITRIADFLVEIFFFDRGIVAKSTLCIINFNQLIYRNLLYGFVVVIVVVIVVVVIVVVVVVIVVVVALIFYSPHWFIFSVTRFGEISPFWLKFTSLGQIFDSLFHIWQNTKSTLAN